MRRALIVLSLLGILTLAGCVRFVEGLPGVPETVKIEGEKYRTGFYDDNLWLQTLTYTGEEYEVNGITFQRVEDGAFSFLRARTGPKTGGMLYCLDTQWQDAKDYYADGENYNYYCIVGAIEAMPDEKQTFAIPDMDLEKFDALTHHGSVFNYDPFDFIHNKAAEYREITVDTSKVDPRPYISFYKDSKDGVFTSYKAHYFFLMDGKLYLARYHNSSEEVVAAVEVPEETADYFIEIIEELTEKDG